jgi:hypothetical protein
MSRRIITQTILDAKSTTGIGNLIFSKDHRHKYITIGTNGLAGGQSVTIKCVGSVQELCPLFGSAQSVANLWDYVQMIDLQDGSSVPGNTGVTFSTADDVQQFAVNVDGLNWISLNITANANTVPVTAVITLYNDSN